MWANRLEVGALSSIAQPLAKNIHRHLQVLGAANIRDTMLHGLVTIGWPEDDMIVDTKKSDRMPEQWAHLQNVYLPPVEIFLAPPNENTPTPTFSLLKSSSLTPLPTSDLVQDQISAPITQPAASASETPTLTPLPPSLPALAAGSSRQISLVGDSMMAVGLSSTILREANKHADLRAIKAFRSGTGLARPDVFNWQTKYPVMIANQQPNIVIVSIGANDAQGFIQNGKVLPFGTDEWVDVYRQRVTDFMDMVSSNSQYVLWVGLPPMKNPSFNAKISRINLITYNVVSQYPRAMWWNPVLYIGDSNGKFRDFGVSNDGKTTRIRSADGIHLSDDGASLLTSELMDWIAPSPH